MREKLEYVVDATIASTSFVGRIDGIAGSVWRIGAIDPPMKTMSEHSGPSVRATLASCCINAGVLPVMALRPLHPGYRKSGDAALRQPARAPASDRLSVRRRV